MSEFICKLRCLLFILSGLFSLALYSMISCKNDKPYVNLITCIAFNKISTNEIERLYVMHFDQSQVQRKKNRRQHE